MILLRTGGGKTLLWQLPALQGGGLTVVVVPSVALALVLKESTDKILRTTYKRPLTVRRERTWPKRTVCLCPAAHSGPAVT